MPLTQHALQLHAALFHHPPRGDVFRCVLCLDAKKADLSDEKIDDGRERLRHDAPAPERARETVADLRPLRAHVGGRHGDIPDDHPRLPPDDRPMVGREKLCFLLPGGEQLPREKDALMPLPCEIFRDGGIAHPARKRLFRVRRAEGAQDQPLRCEHPASQLVHTLLQKKTRRLTRREKHLDAGTPNHRIRLANTGRMALTVAENFFIVVL